MKEKILWMTSIISNYIFGLSKMSNYFAEFNLTKLYLVYLLLKKTIVNDLKIYQRSDYFIIVAKAQRFQFCKILWMISMILNYIFGLSKMSNYFAEFF